MSAHTLGIDLGATKMSLALYDETLRAPLRSTTVPTEAERGWAAVFATLLDAIASMRDAETVVIGLGVPGPVDVTSGTVAVLPNIPGSTAIPLATSLTKETGLLCAIENDARCFTLGESLYGAGKGHETVVGVTCGSGLGGGIVSGGTLVRGAHSLAGEFGHVRLYGDVASAVEAESILSARAIARRFGVTSASDLLLDASQSAAHQSLHREFAALFLSLTYTIDPTAIVVGGGIGPALASHLPAIQSVLQEALLPGSRAPILLSATLADSAMRGAASLAQLSFRDGAMPRM